MLPRAARFLPRCRTSLPALRCRGYVRAEDYDASLRHLFRPRTQGAHKQSSSKAPSVAGGAEPQALPLRARAAAAGMSEAADDPLPKLTACVCADHKGSCGGSVAAPNLAGAQQLDRPPCTHSSSPLNGGGRQSRCAGALLGTCM